MSGAGGGRDSTARERKRIETRARLYDLTIAEFREVGVDKTRIRDVVERAGVVPGTFYFHFPTKSHVLLEFGNRCVADVAAQLPGSIDDPPELGVLLDALSDATARLERDIGNTELLRAAVSVFQRPPEDVEVETAGLVGLLDASIARALVGREDEQDLSPGELAIVILTAFFGALLVAPDDPRQREDQMRKTLGFFAKSLARKPDRD